VARARTLGGASCCCGQDMRRTRRERACIGAHTQQRGGAARSRTATQQGDTGGMQLKKTGTTPSGAPRRRRLRRCCWPAAGIRAPAHPGAHHCRPRPRPPTHLPFQRQLCAPPARAPELDSQRRFGESAGCAALRN
jgi:hypothetical protein